MYLIEFQFKWKILIKFGKQIYTKWGVNIGCLESWKRKHFISSFQPETITIIIWRELHFDFELLEL